MRKLAAFAIGFSFAIIISHYILPHSALPFIAAACFVLFAAAIFLAAKLHIGANLRMRIALLLISLSLGFIWSFTYTAIFVKPLWELQEKEVSAKAVVLDFPAERDPDGFRVDVKIQIDGYPAAGARLYYYNQAALSPGDVIQISAKLRRSDITSEGERYDTQVSKGIFLSGYVSGNIDIISNGGGFLHIPKRFAQSLSDKTREVFSEETSPFIAALLLGKRDDLFRDAALNASLSASGIIHVVSVSGMHISFLMGFLGIVIKNKRLFAIYAIPILFFFMAMTGFTSSVTRAGIMQIFIIVAPLIRREGDSLTSLSAAVLLLLLINPYSCASVGFQLSFAATLGIILFTSRIHQAFSDITHGKKIAKNKAAKGIINYVSSSISTTIGALSLTLPLSVIHFGYISLISPITNLFTVGIISLVFPIGLIAAFISYISPFLSGFLSVPVDFAVIYVISAARILSSIPYCVVYASNTHILFWLAYVYSLFIIMPLLKARPRQYILPVCISVMLLFAVILTSIVIPVSSEDTVTVLDIGQGLCVVVASGENTMVVDCGSSSTSKAGAIAHEYLLSLGKTAIDLMVITHFHADHINSVEFLLGRVNISALAVPWRDGSYYGKEIIELARRYGTDIIYVTEVLSLTIGNLEVTLYPPPGGGDENETGLTILTTGAITSLITGDMGSFTERILLRYYTLPELDLLVVGHHGSRYSTSPELLNALLPKIAVISVGRNSFGHPHPDTLNRLWRVGAAVYRTDEQGHVVIGG
ncbi:MAG: DNA internalization-related competence protein ComEC/Rec2 [Oscillospiraceae bacterium]|nr:DNA internalization-related competence protein ComEC/Rec2 [Oscillospiraceae bacterium]